MDFFAAKDRARYHTKLLLVYFLLAVGMIILSLYCVVKGFLYWGNVAAYQTHQWPYQDQATSMGHFSMWDPQVFGWVAGGTLLVILGGCFSKMIQLKSGGYAVAESLGAEKVSVDTQDPKKRQLLNVVEEMAIATGLRAPTVYLLPKEESINAFAAGFHTDDAVIAVTAGCLQQLSREELQGVIAHEFSHILSRDMRLNIRLIGLLFGILLLTTVGYGLLRTFVYGEIGRRRRDGRTFLFMVLLGFSLITIGYIGVFFARLIQSAISRQREFLADASAVQFTRNPSGLVGALKRIGEQEKGRIRSAHAHVCAHLFFSCAFKKRGGGWFDTHPPLAERIRAIEQG